MNFSIVSPMYFLALAVVVTLFYLSRSARLRMTLLVVVGYVFYFVLSPHLWLVLIALVIIGFLAGNAIATRPKGKVRQIFFAVAVVLLAAPLAFFKYLNFIAFQIDWALHLGPSWHAGWATSALLPLGISFYTFQVIAYVADVYLGINPPERDPLRFALFLGFFPLLTAGPIERYSELMPQFDEPARFRCDPVFNGIRLIVFGLALKFAVADVLSAPIAAVFDGNDAALAQPPADIVAAIFFSFQAYADVFGYSLIAVGTGCLFGIDLTMNFKRPFFAGDTQEFWRRWHISLSNWLRDYLYVPMRAHWRRLPTMGPVIAVVLTFLIAGLWHGAGWNFLAYGLTQGVLLGGSILTLRRRNAFWKKIGVPTPVLMPVRVLITFLMVSASLVFVRVHDLGNAATIAGRFFQPRSYTHLANLDAKTFAPAYWLCVGVVIGSDAISASRFHIDRLPRVVQALVYGICGSVILFTWIISRVPQPFIYYKY